MTEMHCICPNCERVRELILLPVEQLEAMRGQQLEGLRLLAEIAETHARHARSLS